MPARRKGRRRYGARRIKRRRIAGRKRYRLKRRGRATVGRIRSISAFPDRMFLKLRYTSNFTATLLAADLGANIAFRGNSIYDPLQSLGGHQPYSYDNWALLYKRYRVRASKITLIAQHSQYSNTSDQATANNNGFTCAIVPVTDDSVVYDQTITEMPRCRVRQNWGQNIRPLRIKHYATTSQIWGVSKVTAGTNAEFTAPVNNDPASQWYWWIRFERPVPLAGTATQQIANMARITYYVEFYDRKWLPRS